MQEVMATRAFSPYRRVHAWNEAASTFLCPMNVSPRVAQDFHGEMRRDELESIRTVDISCSAARVDRTPSHVTQTRGTAFTLDLQISGRSVVRQMGREARLVPGDFVLTDSTRPYQVTFEETVTMRLLRIPAALFRRYVGCPEELVGLRVDGHSGLGLLASRFLAGLGGGAGALHAVAGVSHVERATLELIAAAYAPFRPGQVEGTSLATLHRLQIVEHIERDLGNPRLSPASIGSALRITPRYVHRLFSTDGESVGRYILRRRLERCAQQLADPLHARRRVGEIALDAGFSTAAHFCRCFRRAYGVTPGEYRESPTEGGR